MALAFDWAGELHIRPMVLSWTHVGRRSDGRRYFQHNDVEDRTGFSCLGFVGDPRNGRAAAEDEAEFDEMTAERPEFPWRSDNPGFLGANAQSHSLRRIDVHDAVGLRRHVVRTAT